MISPERIFRPPDARCSAALTVLTRLARRRPGTEGNLRRALQDRADERLLFLALEVAIETGDPVGRVLAELLREVRDEDLVGALAEYLDASPGVNAVSLRELALEIVTLSVEIRRNRWSNPTVGQRIDIAELELTRGLRLQENGRREEGALVTRSAVEEIRALVSVEPKARPLLARALKHLADQIRELDRLSEALSIVGESVEIFTSLAEDGASERQLDLAHGLESLGICLSESGRFERALVPLSSALDILTACRSPPIHCATCQLNLGLANWHSGRVEAAVRNTGEALDIIEVLFDEQPLVAGPDFARGLSNLSMMLNGLELFEEAQAAIEDALEIRRQLARDRPEIFGLDLARSLTNHGLNLGMQAKPKEALAVLEEAVAILRALGASQPLPHRSTLASALVNLGSFLFGAGELSAAAEIQREAVGLFEANEQGENISFLATAYLNLGATLFHLGNSTEAIGIYRKAIDGLRRARGAQGMEESALGHHLARALERLALMSAELGRAQEALPLAEEAVSIRRMNAGTHPRQGAALLAKALTTCGLVLSYGGRWGEALSHGQKAVEIRKKRSAKNIHDPELADLLRQLADRLASFLPAESAELHAASRNLLDAAGRKSLVPKAGRFPTWQEVLNRHESVARPEP